jgi:hypothetical protein
MRMMKSSNAKSPRAAAKKTTMANGTHPVAVAAVANGVPIAEPAVPAAEPTVSEAASAVSAGSISPTLEQVRLRAYELYLERGGTPGGELYDWIRAERELSGARARHS